MKDDADEIEVDLFAGGGGASLGIERAIGRPPTVAINHNEAALAMHAANHPRTRHYREDVWKASARKVTGDRPVGLLWASPDCKHFSRAKGSKPVEKSIRSLAWVVVRWAEQVGPRVVILENVREFEDWGPLLPLWACRGCDWTGTEGQARLARTRRRCPRCDSAGLRQTDKQVPDPARKGLTFRRFVGRLRNLGYAVEWGNLNAADFGAPTHRRRLFLVARIDGEPIRWPEPTHADPKKIAVAAEGLFPSDLRPWRTAAECIDWSIPCPSIFLTREEGRKLGVKRPLADKTLRRIAMGVKRYVLDNPRPFVVYLAHGGHDYRHGEVDAPVNTIHAGGKSAALCTPTLIRFRGDPGGGANIEAPMPTVTAGSFVKRPGGAGHALGLCTPIVVPVTHHGERRAHSPDEPLPTVTGANRGEMAVVSPVLVRGSQTGGNGKYANGADEPLTTVVSKAEHMLIAPTLVQTGCGEREGQDPRCLDIEAPLGTVVAGGAKHAMVSAFLAKHYGGVVGHTPDRPLGTVTGIDHHSVVAANLVHLNHGEKTESAADDPMRTVTASGNHAALVYSFLTKYYRTAVGQSPAAPLHTITTDDRFGVVMVTIDGQDYAIVDIGMRMLRPRELATAQGCPPSYVLTGTITSQVERIGNMVPPDLAEAVCRANYQPAAAGVVA